MNRRGPNSYWRFQFKVSWVRNGWKVVRGGTLPQIWWMQLKYLFQQLKWPSRKLQWWGRAHEHTGRNETQKYLRKCCYHHIKCNSTTILTTFMWRRPLNSAVLATTTHRKPKRVSDGIGTQVRAQTINKYRIKMIQKELYNVRDPPWEKDRKNRERNTVTIKIIFVFSLIDLYKDLSPQTGNLFRLVFLILA